jgi:DNA-binding transcriptional MocR family regulator
LYCYIILDELHQRQVKASSATTTTIGGETTAAIAASVESAVVAGSLRRGDLLPPVRSLARELGVSPTTVAAAYRELRVRGIVTTAGRRGTRIAQRPPLSLRATAAVPAASLHDLWSGTPDPELLPRLAPLLRGLDDDREPTYGTFAKLPELVELVQDEFLRDGVPADGIAVVSSTLDGLERVLQAHLLPGDAIAVEDPAFPNVLDLVAALGLRAEPVAVDEQGPRPDALADALARGARAFVVTPRAQNPTGAIVSPTRASDLRHLLQERNDVLLVEDDYFAALDWPGLQTLVEPGRDRWALLRSSSKALGPDLRCGFVAADATTLARVEGRQLLGPGWVSQLLQRLVHGLLADATVRGGLDDARRVYDSRREELKRLLADAGFDAYGSSGFNVWIPLAHEAEVVTQLAALGWAVAPGERFRIASPPAVRVTASRLDPATAGAFVDALVRATRPSDRANTA